jgi:hypothetical protein
MIGDPAAMRAWLEAHGLVEAELLHVLPNHGPDGADLLTDPERLLLSELLEVRRAVIPGHRPTPPDRSTAGQERPCSAEPAGLFDPDAGGPSEWAGVQPASRHARPPDRPAARQHPQPPAARPRRQREQEEERQR